jgi:hypothetical protein
MRQGLRIATVIMAVLFVCAAALAQTTKKPAPKAAADAGQPVDAGAPVLRPVFQGATKAPPMDFRDEPYLQQPTKSAPGPAGK